MKAQKKVQKVRTQVHLTKAVFARVQKTAKMNKTTNSAVVEEALVNDLM